MGCLFVTVGGASEGVSLVPRVPIIALPPVPCGLLPRNTGSSSFVSGLARVGRSHSHAIVVNLLRSRRRREGIGAPSRARSFCGTVGRDTDVRPRCRFVLLAGRKRIRAQLFSLPPGVTVCHLPHLRTLLPLYSVTLVAKKVAR